MKLFCYYALHTVKNQLKKLFKTWVLIFLLACVLFGAIIGFGAATLEDAFGEDIPEDGYIEEVPPTQEDEIPPEIAQGLVELLAGGIILLIFVTTVMGADKNGSTIFQPADVALLFASPMKPQSVLLFRLMTQLGIVIVSTLYLIFQLPNLMLNLGLGVWDAIGVMAAWFLTFGIGKLLQILVYVLTATHSHLKKYIRRSLYLFLLLIAGSYLLYQRITGLDYFSAALGFFNHPISRYIPVWGWLKAFLLSVFAGNLFVAALSFLAVIAAGALLVFLIWHMKADFYEDAMAKTAETAELQEIAQSESSTGFVKRKKDRSDKLRRDGLNRGWGASVFFWRAMYNRFRFAHFGILTKTSETYLLASVAVGCLCRFLIGTDGVLPTVLVLSFLAFYRTLGNPLQEDSSKDFYRLIPESADKKLFYSILSGTVTCLMDLIPGLLATAILFPASCLALLAWLPFILSIDFYGSNVTAFINLSAPVKAGNMVKQLVAILFIYFGLLPDVVIIVLGFVFENIPLAAIACGMVNFLLGGIFLLLSPLFLEPKEQPYYPPVSRTPEELKKAKRAFSRLGLGCFVMIFVSTLLQGLWQYFLPATLQHPYWVWVATFAPIYLVAIPLGLMLFRKEPPLSLPKSTMKPGKTVKTVFICIFLMYSGNLLGQLITGLLGSLIGTSAEAGITDLIMEESTAMKLLFIVILAPLIEEFVFRKQLIDRMAPYGEKLAVVTSALLFGLFHGNFSQFFYAFALGLVFGYVYLKTGKLRYSIGLHMGINFMGSVFSSWLLENLGVFEVNGALTDIKPFVMVIFIGWLLFILAGSVVGLILLCRSIRHIYFTPTEQQLPKGKKLSTVYVNAGMLLFILACLAMFALSLLPL